MAAGQMNDKDLARFISAEVIKAQIVHLEEVTPTVEAAAAAVGVMPDQIGKSLLFLADGQPLLVIANGTRRVGYKRLAQHLGLNRKRLKMANAQEVLDITGFPVGTVPPFGHKKRLDTLIEKNVLEQDAIYAGGGAINALLHLTTAELQRVTQGEPVSL